MTIRNPFIKSGKWMVLLPSVIFMVLVSACAYHPPAPIEEQSGGIITRQLNSDGSYYVRSGDTLYAIAFGYRVDPMDVAKWNNISSPYTIYPGQLLRLTPPTEISEDGNSGSGVKINTVKSPGQAKTRTVTDTAKPPQSGAVTEEPVLPPASAPSAPPVSKTADTKTVTGTSGTSNIDPKAWMWPTKGRVLRAYIAGDSSRNGLDIAGKEGQPIFASAGGQVVYSGSGLIGYGELIIIKHSEKMLSAYAHNKVRLAKEGDEVSAGQKIAEMGRNSANEQLLHFEIRVYGKPEDPLKYLP